ncbi:MAG: TonB-dependent receptor [Methylophilaceae bacterium]
MKKSDTKRIQHQFKPKTLYLAVILSMKTLAAMAEEPIKQNPVEINLEEVEVQAFKAAPVSYQATKTRVGKVLQDPQDIPQAVTIITNTLMHDQQVSTLREALHNVSGLTFNAAEGGRSGDNMNLRGFYTFGDIYLDGIRDTAQYNRESFNLEQIDVLRGSAAMLFGRGQAGGVINQVSKIAHLKDDGVVTASLGEFGYRQITVDVNKQLGDSAAIRVNVMDRDEETYRANPASGDSPEFDRKGIAFSIGVGIETENEFFLNHVTTKTNDIPDYGVRFNDADGNTNALVSVSSLTRRPTSKLGDEIFFGGDKNFDDSETRITTGIFTHQIGNDTQLRIQLRHAEYERDYWAKTPLSATEPNATLSNGGNQVRASIYKTNTLQSDFSTLFKMAGMKHQVLAGVEYMNEDSYRQALRNIGTAINPIYNKENVTGIANTFKANNYAIYGQDSIEFVKNWNLLLGVRHDKMLADYSSVTSPSLNYGENSYRTGLSWHPKEDAHYYVSYSDSFSPTADLYQLTVAPLPPERSETVELGAKWLLIEGDLALRTALYSSTKEWERNTDLESTSTILTKKRRTNGLEFEAAGRVTDKWQVFGGIALMDAKILVAAENISPTTGLITFADKRFEGQRARNTPVATLNLWSTYQLTSKWKLGGGIEAKGQRYGYSPTQTSAQTIVGSGPFRTGVFDPNVAPGYARLDALVAYEEKKWSVRLNVKNLLDKTYYDSIYDNGGFAVPGNRRQAIITTEYKF